MLTGLQEALEHLEECSGLAWLQLEGGGGREALGAKEVEAEAFGPSHVPGVWTFCALWGEQQAPACQFRK